MRANGTLYIIIVARAITILLTVRNINTTNFDVADLALRLLIIFIFFTANYKWIVFILF